MTKECNFENCDVVLNSTSKYCKFHYNKIYYSENRDKVLTQKREYTANNKEKKRTYDKKYVKDNKDKISKDRKKYYSKNKENKKEYDKKYRQTEEFKLKSRIHSRKKYHQNKNDPAFLLRNNFSSRIFLELKARNSSKNNTSFMKKIDYSINDLKIHLESLFEPWMNWNNHGKYIVSKWDDNDPATWTWQIDHIIPHSTFKYISMDDQSFKDCWALSNLRPYSAKQNIIDGNRRNY